MAAGRKKRYTGIMDDRKGENKMALLEVQNVKKIYTTRFDMIPSSRTQKYKNLLGGILCPEKVKLMQ